jgi:hypothetical protein
VFDRLGGIALDDLHPHRVLALHGRHVAVGRLGRELMVAGDQRAETRLVVVVHDGAERVLGGDEEVLVQLTEQDRRRDRRALRDSGHRVTAGRRFPPQQVGDELASCGDLAATADHHELVDAGGTNGQVREALLDGPPDLVQLRFDRPLEQLSGDREVAAVRQPQVNLLLGGEQDLDAFHLETELGLLHRVPGRPGRKLRHYRGGEVLVQIDAAGAGDTFGGALDEHTLDRLQHGHVERATTPVENEYVLVVGGVDRERHRRRGRLVDQCLYLDACKARADLGAKAGQSPAVGGDRHHRPVNRDARRRGADVPEQQCGGLLDRDLVAADVHGVLGGEQPFHGTQLAFAPVLRSPTE